jgi:hypothetical protein
MGRGLLGELEHQVLLAVLRLGRWEGLDELREGRA